MSRLLVLLQVMSIGLLIWTVVLGFAVLQGKVTPSTHMNVAVMAASVSAFTHTLAAAWFFRRLRR